MAKVEAQQEIQNFKQELEQQHEEYKTAVLLAFFRHRARHLIAFGCSMEVAPTRLNER